VDLDLAPRRLQAIERPLVRAGEHLAGDDLVALGHLVEDRRAEVGEGGAEALELLAHARRARRDPRRPAVVDDLGVQELLEGALVGAGLVLVDEATDDVLGLHAPRIAARRRAAHR
jgi:hypothetical protein